MSVNICWPTWMPTLRLTCSMMKSIAWQNSAGTKTHPCLTPEVVMNGMERHPAKRTLADVKVCRSIIKSIKCRGNTDTMHGLPERIPINGIKRRLQVHKCNMQWLLKFSVDFR